MPNASVALSFLSLNIKEGLTVLSLYDLHRDSGLGGVFFALDSWEMRAGFKPCEIQSVTDIASKPY